MLSAHKKALKGKRCNANATNFDYKLMSYLTKLQTELINNKYKPLTYRKRIILEPKVRLIEAPAYRDRIVHHSIHQHLSPFYDRIFIDDSYACRKGHGIHSAASRVQQFLRQSKTDLYVCQLDISKYYASINQEKLINILETRIKDEPLMNLLKVIIDSTDSGNEHDHLFTPDSYYFTKGKRGIPIGNLTSQLFANIYLHQADNYAKRNLKIRNYVRYMDDILFFHHDKAQLHEWKKAMTKFLYEELYLTINPRKVRIYPASQGVSFVGYAIYHNHLKLRGSSVKRFKKNYRKQLSGVMTGDVGIESMQKSFTAWTAHASHARSQNLIDSLRVMQEDPIFVHDIKKYHQEHAISTIPPVQLSLFNKE